MTQRPEHEEAYRAWWGSLRTLTVDADALQQWQDRRFAFAARVGDLLTNPYNSHDRVSGPVLYGIYLNGDGPAYVGQSKEGERRLRDLPIGESHHLANTIPPEIWQRVVVVSWPSLLDALPIEERERIEGLGGEVCGLALEHLLQVELCPPLNSRRRHRDGHWRPRKLESSRSKGAQQAGCLFALYERVRDCWSTLATADVPTGDAIIEPVVLSEYGRVVFPAVSLSAVG
ncbi:GIY-YIG nuclease family protein [Kitasatospora sp. GP82]|uniref:GIY-YIG nuclease family protein n=1 Tax=Kitasatospora sp. GP82 TaxID=3035089 RepID=UPI0024731298|nr:GIY-YIG nuclease family protein [Kitasatospora sp. GP82]MDH6123644.1 hypothetical protein [Kitasatospora sp. GP82]